MLYKKSLVQRASLLLAVFSLLGAVCWLDTLDLTDDILQSQPLMIGLQAIEPEEEGRDFLLSFVTAALVFRLVSAVSSSFQSSPCSSARLASLPSDRPLYQSFCTYRI